MTSQDPGAVSAPQGSPSPSPAVVPTHMTKAVLSTLFCCVPLGIVAIVNAAQVNNKLAAGDYGGAQESANNANKWGNIAIGLGLVFGIIYALVMLESEL